MKKLSLLQFFLLSAFLTLSGQSFDFRMPNSNFVLIPGGGFESHAWVDVPQGDSVILTTSVGPGLMAVFQPSIVRQSCLVYIVVISTDSTLAQQQSMSVCARHNNDSITRVLDIRNNNDGHGFYLIDSARTWLDTVYGYLKHSFPTQKIFLNNLQQLPWASCFPYPPLLVVTHHLFIHENWRATVLWHNMIPPDDWVKVYIYNEEIDSCYGVKIDTWGDFSLIPCEIMHYNQQDTIMNIYDIPEGPVFRLWPNPADDKLFISFNEEIRDAVQLTVMNMEGRIIQKTELKDREYCIDINHLPAGIYAVMAGKSDRCRMLKFVKR